MRPIYKILFGISLALVVGAAVSLAVFGLNLGVDFKGGSVVEYHFASRPPLDDIQHTLTAFSGRALHDASAALAGDHDLIIKAGELSEQDHQELRAGLAKAFPSSGVEELQFSSVGPVVGAELKHKSITAIIVVLIAISIYIAYVFRKLGGILSPWVMGVAAICALIHDLVIPTGVFALLGHYGNVEIGAVFVAAVLTILGYSISDTVVVFDRVRENVVRSGIRADFGEVVHRSILQTLVRSVNTNVTTLLSLVAIYFFGGESVRHFALALIMGIVLGAVSSISVASPLLIWWSRPRR